MTHAGCGAICPAYDRGCYGCFGPKETPNPRSLNHWVVGMGVDQADLVPRYRHVNALAEEFAAESRDAEVGETAGPHPERRPHDNQATTPERWGTKPEADRWAAERPRSRWGPWRGSRGGRAARAGARR